MRTDFPGSAHHYESTQGAQEYGVLKYFLEVPDGVTKSFDKTTQSRRALAVSLVFSRSQNFKLLVQSTFEGLKKLERLCGGH